MSDQSIQQQFSSQKPWLASYPATIPHQIHADTYPSLSAMFEMHCQEFAHLPAFVCMGKTINYAQLLQYSTAFGAYLQSLGLVQGDRVALMMPNVLQYPIALLAILRAGLIVVNVNPMYTARELEHQLNDSGAKAIVVIENFAHTLAQVVQKTAVKHVITTQLGDLLGFGKRHLVNWIVKHRKKLVPAWQINDTVSFLDALQRGSHKAFKAADLSHDDIAFLQYTGGTTGVAKGAMLTHENILSHIEQILAWLEGRLKPGEETVITALPIYHIFSLTVNCLLFMRLGAKNVLIPNPRDMTSMLGDIKKHGFTVITAVNTLFNGMLNCPIFPTLDFSKLKIVLGGGAPVQHAVAERWQKITGKPLTEAYGLTECSPGVCANLFDRPYSGNIGLPFPSTELSIRDDAFNEVPIGQPGEICVRGPQVMKGYWQRPDATAEILTTDGWLKTGDIGVMDEHGITKITDRKKDMVLVSGFNVYPNEVEDVVAELDGVLECAVIGVKDEKTGEAVKVFIVKKTPELTKEEVLAHCKTRLTAYKQPRYVEFRESLPKSPVGKILRRELRDEAK